MFLLDLVGLANFLRFPTPEMTSRTAICLFDALRDEWWTWCQPLGSLELGHVLSWMAMLHGDDTMLQPLRVFKAGCSHNTVGWRVVVVVVFIRTTAETMEHFEATVCVDVS